MKKDRGVRAWLSNLYVLKFFILMWIERERKLYACQFTCERVTWTIENHLHLKISHLLLTFLLSISPWKKYEHQHLDDQKKKLFLKMFPAPFFSPRMWLTRPETYLVQSRNWWNHRAIKLKRSSKNSEKNHECTSRSTPSTYKFPRSNSSYTCSYKKDKFSDNQ